MSLHVAAQTAHEGSVEGTPSLSTHKRRFSFDDAQELLSWRSSDSIASQTSLVANEELSPPLPSQSARHFGILKGDAAAARSLAFSTTPEGERAVPRSPLVPGTPATAEALADDRSSSASPPSRERSPVVRRLVRAPGGMRKAVSFNCEVQDTEAISSAFAAAVRMSGADQASPPRLPPPPPASIRLDFEKYAAGPHAVRRVLQTEGRETVASPPIIRLPSSSLLGQRVQSYPNLASEAAMEDEEEVVVREDVAAPLPRHLQRRASTGNLPDSVGRSNEELLAMLSKASLAHTRRRASSGVVNGVATAGGRLSLREMRQQERLRRAGPVEDTSQSTV